MFTTSIATCVLGFKLKGKYGLAIVRHFISGAGSFKGPSFKTKLSQNGGVGYSRVGVLARVVTV